MKPNQIASVLSRVLLVTLLLHGLCAAQQPATAPSSDTKSVLLPGTQVRVMVPMRFVHDQRGSAWIDEKQQIIIAAHIVPLSVDQAVDVFVKKAKTEGFPLTRGDVNLDNGRAAKFVQITDQRGYSTLFVMFEEGGKTVAASGIYRTGSAQSTVDEVRQSLLTARVDASVQTDPFENLPYRADVP